MVRGRVPARSMKRPSWKLMSRAGSLDTPKRIWCPFLVILAHEAVESGAAAVLGKAGVEVSVELELAGKGRGSFRWAHASDGEGAYGVLVAESQEVRGVRAEEGHDHITRDA